ncbi:MAG: CHAT domain-containing protein [Anaerolineae bacterium]|nr:CHAT domain-containing protein [Anaerolineae bacterium]
MHKHTWARYLKTGRPCSDLRFILLLCIIVAGLGILIPSAGCVARGAASQKNTSPLIDLEPMQMTGNSSKSESAFDGWLRLLRFIDDPDLGRFRNPFDFPYAENDPALEECFISAFNLQPLRTPGHSLVLGEPGSGKTALCKMLKDQLEKDKLTTVTSSLDRFTTDFESQTTAAKDHTYILLDVADREDIDEKTWQVLRRVFNNDRTGNVSAKVFLPARFRLTVKDLSPLELLPGWPPEKLEALIQSRMGWASGGTFSSLAEISDRLLQERSPDTMLATMALTPRMLLQLGQRLFDLRASRSIAESTPLLQAEDWLDFLPLSSPVPPAAPSRASRVPPIPLRLRLKYDPDERTMSVIGLGEARDQEEQMGPPHKETFSADRLPLIMRTLRGGDYQGKEERKVLQDLDLLDEQGREKKLGKHLYDWLGDQVKGSLRESRKYTNAALPVHLYFHAEEYPLFVISCPWELIHDGKRHLAVERNEFGISLVRHLIYGDKPLRLGTALPIRVLYVAPRLHHAELPEWTAREEWEAIPLSCRVQQEPDDICTFDALRARLKAGSSATILHFDGHGCWGAQCPDPTCRWISDDDALRCEACGADLCEIESTSYLFFETEDGEIDPVSAERFQNCVEGRGLAAIILSTCESAAVGGSSVFNSMAPGLFLAHIPALVGMQFSIKVKPAYDFMQAFYDVLGQTGCLTEAVAAGRDELKTTPDWYVPVLYLRGEDDEGRFFSPLS